MLVTPEEIKKATEILEKAKRKSQRQRTIKKFK